MSTVPELRAKQGNLVVRPGGLIAILGGGQLGRMPAMAARRVVPM